MTEPTVNIDGVDVPKYMIPAAKNEPINLFGIEAPEGWKDLIQYTIKRIDEEDLNKEVRLFQVKDKFGELRIYADGAGDKVFKLLTWAEQASHCICENCAAVPAYTKSINSWIYTMCEECEKRMRGEKANGRD